MDLHGLVSPVVDSVNPNISVTIQASTGYANTGPGLRQVPVYGSPVTGFGQVQALSSSELRQAEGMNLQGVMRKIYLRGGLNGVIRPNSVGGDLVIIAGQTWLVIKTLELWPTWSCALIVLQDTGAGGGMRYAYAETPSGVIDGENVYFTLAHSPNPPNSLALFLGGLIQQQGAGDDYTLSGNQITYSYPPIVGPLLAWYPY